MKVLFTSVNTLRPRQDGRHFPDIFKWIFVNEIIWILIITSLKFVPSCQINNIPALVQIMAWRRPGDKPLFEPMMVSLLTHTCVTRPQWVKWNIRKSKFGKLSMFSEIPWKGHPLWFQYSITMYFHEYYSHLLSYVSVAYIDDSSDQDIQLGYQYIWDFIIQGLLIFT